MTTDTTTEEPMLAVDQDAEFGDGPTLAEPETEPAEMDLPTELQAAPADIDEAPNATEEEPEASTSESDLPGWGECEPYGCAPDYDMVPPGALEEAWGASETPATITPAVETANPVTTTPTAVPEMLAETGAVDYALGAWLGLLLVVAGLGVVVLGRMKRR